MAQIIRWKYLHSWGHRCVLRWLALYPDWVGLQFELNVRIKSAVSYLGFLRPVLQNLSEVWSTAAAWHRPVLLYLHSESEQVTTDIESPPEKCYRLGGFSGIGMASWLYRRYLASIRCATLAIWLALTRLFSSLAQSSSSLALKLQNDLYNKAITSM